MCYLIYSSIVLVSSENFRNFPLITQVKGMAGVPGELRSSKHPFYGQPVRDTPVQHVCLRNI